MKSNKKLYESLQKNKLMFPKFTFISFSVLINLIPSL